MRDVAKNRMIRTEIWTDDKFVSLSPLARLLFIGMWNFACDNGHLDNSILQLKMRVLPADNCDVAELVNEIVESEMVADFGQYLKVVNLSALQPLDLRYLQFCDHCGDDPDAHYTREDKKDGKGQRASGTRATPEPPASGPRRGDGDGDGDGDGESAGRKRPKRAIPDNWKPTQSHEKYANEHGLDLSSEAFRFRNHAHSVDRRCANWNSAFTNWLSKAKPAPRAVNSDNYWSNW